MKKALILTDIQNDFIPGGALAVPNGNEVVPVANRLMPQYDLVVATQDWHPENHVSFASRHNDKEVGDVIEWQGREQVLWPDHCVRETHGADLVDKLSKAHIQKVFKKGTDPDVDSYSGFFDDNGNPTGLGDFLKKQNVDEIHVMGLATDYCVKFTVLDSLKLGFTTFLMPKGCRAVELNEGDGDKAIEEMKKSGAKVIEEI